MTDREITPDVADAVAIVEALGGDVSELAFDIPTLSSTAADLTLAQGVTLTFDQLSARSTIDAARLRNIFGYLGIALLDSAPQFDEADVAFVQAVADVPSEWVDEDGQAEVLRVVGRAMATAAEAAIGFHLRTIEPRARSANDWTRANADMASFARRLDVNLGTVFRHHMRQVIDLQRASFVPDEDSGEIVQLGIAFVDLSGFTARSESGTLHDIVPLIERFESTASQVAADHQCRVVKFIGDEVMLSGVDPTHVAAAAQSFVAAMAEQGVTAHGGMSYGPVVMLHGDYFGPVVNLAARLVDESDPGQILTNAATAAALSLQTPALRTSKLRGVMNPVTMHEL